MSFEARHGSFTCSCRKVSSSLIAGHVILADEVESDTGSWLEEEDGGNAGVAAIVGGVGGGTVGVGIRLWSGCGTAGVGNDIEDGLLMMGVVFSVTFAMAVFT